MISPKVNSESSIFLRLFGMGIGLLGGFLIAIRTNFLGVADGLNAAGKAIGDAVPALRPFLEGLKEVGTQLGILPPEAEAGPEWQLLTEEDWEDDNLEQRQYHCSICFARLDYLKDTETVWICSHCSQTYDMRIQDTPVKDLSESKVRTYTELSRYPTYEENDIYMPFVQGIDVGEQDNVPRNVEVIYDDGKHKHIRVKGLPTEALSIMNELDGRT